MDVIAALGPLAAPGAEPEGPDGTDPGTAAEFAVLLAGLVMPQAASAATTTAATDGGPTDPESSASVPAVRGTDIGVPPWGSTIDGTHTGPGAAPADAPVARSAAPAAPTLPPTRAVPATPTDRGAPATPADPGTSATPATPAVPAVPAQHATPATHGTAATRAVPATPATHETRTTPAVRATPAVPATPAHHGTPATPAVPAVPAVPATSLGAERRSGEVDRPVDGESSSATSASSELATSPEAPPSPSPSLPGAAAGLDDSKRGERLPDRTVEPALGGPSPIDRAAHAPTPDAVAALTADTPAGNEDNPPAGDPPDTATAVGLDAATTARPASTAGVATAGPSALPGARGIERALAAQLVERVGTLRHREDGDYELTIQLEPADLGRVELRVRLEGGAVHVRVGAESVATTDLVRRSLPELRAALVQAGLDAGTLDVGSQPGQWGADTTPRHDDDATRSSEPPRPAPSRARSVAPVHHSTHAGVRSGVDVLL